MDCPLARTTGENLRRALYCAWVICAVAAGGLLPVPASAVSALRSIAPLPEVRREFTATLLNDGRVLVAGGNGDEVPPAESALLYDPKSNAWVPAGRMIEPRRLHTATLLTDGRVLVYGGRSMGPEDYNLATAEIYDPAGGSWTAAGSTGPRAATSRHLDASAPGAGRMHHTATLLKDGRVLVAGGHTAGHGQGYDDAWLYDPAKNAWAQAGSFATGRRSHSANLLNDGRVLITGGQQGGHDASLNDGAVWDPASGRWSAARGLMTTGRGGHASALMSNGKALISGGRSKLVGGGPEDTLASTETFDPATGRFSASAPMPTPRHFHEALTDPAGRIVVAGGVRFGSGEPVESIEAYDPASGYWSGAGKAPAAKDSEAGLMDFLEVLWLSPGTCGDGCRELLMLDASGGRAFAHRYPEEGTGDGSGETGGARNSLPLPLIGAEAAGAAAIIYFLLLSPGARRRRRHR